MIRIQRGLAVAGRLTLMLGTQQQEDPDPGGRRRRHACSALHKILENMEIGHNVMHGQWDWMNDPEIHSSNWEWDTAQPAEQWKHSHNYVHHQFTNVLGYDNDIGYGILRMAREQKWSPFNVGQPVYNALLAGLFQWGVALHDLDIEAIRKGKKDPKEMKRQLKQIWRKGRNQALKDYVVYPALSGPQWRTTMAANGAANFTRNVWSYVIIFCGHFPDGAMHFTEEEIEDETRAEWYLRQILGAANFKGGPLLHIMSGNLGLPDRAPPVPGPAEQQVRRDLGQGAGALREVRHPLHDRTAAPAVRPGAAHDHEAVAAQRDDVVGQARAARPAGGPRPQVGLRAARSGAPSWAPGRGCRARSRRPYPGLAGSTTGAGSPSARCRGSAAAAVRRWAGRSCSSARPTRWRATRSTCRRCTWRAPRSCAPVPAPTRPGSSSATSGFEFVRPTREDLDQEPRFEPNSLLGAQSSGDS